MIKRIVKLTFREESVADFLDIFETNQHRIRHAEGCLSLELLRGVAPSNVLFTYSWWESEEHLNAYRDSDLFKETWRKVKLLFADRPLAWSVESLVKI